MTEQKQKRRIAILGSTGSIGIQTLDVVRSYPEIFSAEVLTSNSSAELLVTQALEFNPNAIAIADDSKYEFVAQALKNTDIKVFAGDSSVSDLAASDDVDVVVMALVGFAGLRPSMNAIQNGKHIALATKEVLVVAGELVMEAALKNRVAILPVDSEHSAILQCLMGESQQSVEKIILTASGGPFKGFSKSQLEKVTIKDALDHPNWSMGKKITIDSASLMNKGLEVIEAGHLFHMSPEQIDVVVHPQSVIHSMVQFCDGSVKAQLGLPDMHLPILYALGFPHRLPSDLERIEWHNISSLTFEKPDTQNFPSLLLAYEAMKKGGSAPCVLNAANEAAVEAFLSGRIRFVSIPHIIEDTLGNDSFFIKNPTMDDFFEINKNSRNFASEMIAKKYTV
jgi:1-deoxy-D-xylulose-5-phosphate reductoisomerase